MSCSSAASRMVRLNMKTWSASSSGSPCRRLISIWATPLSWIRVSISSPWASEYSYMSSKRASNSLTAAMEYPCRPVSGRPDRPTGGRSG